MEIKQAQGVPGGGRDAMIRLWTAGDAVSPITRLLHRAYAKQVAMGLRPLAGRQEDDVTHRRLSSGESYLAVARHALLDEPVSADGDVIGVIIFNERETSAGPAWFAKPGVGSFSQFAVDPMVQSKGIGRALLDKVESRASELGLAELALSMAEPDHGLRDYYLRRGYRVISIWKWPYTNYSSLVMSKKIGSKS
jgi:GNAT superfamily N-acetyltransferase